MASDGPPGGNVFRHTDPFRDDEIQQERENSVAELGGYQRQNETSAPAPPASGDDEVEEGLRLAGVRSHNPWANSSRNESRVHGSSTSDDDRDLLARRDQEAIDRVLTANGGGGGRESAPNALESVPTGSAWRVPTEDAVSPGAGGHGTASIGTGDPQSEKIDRHDYFPPPSPANARSGKKHDPADADEAHDSYERGTDVFAITNPDWPEDSEEKESPGHSGSSDSSSAKKNEKRIGFADQDRLDSAADPSSSDDVGEGIVEKLKSAAKDTFQLQDMKVSGPLKRFNPTNVKMRVRYGSTDASAGADPREVGIIWRSRDNRKGRNSVVVPRTAMAYPNLPPKSRPVYSSSFKGVARNLFRMCFSFPYWDMAFWSGWSYTWGSVLFVIDGVWAWGPVGGEEDVIVGQKAPAWGKVKWEVEQTYTIGIFFFVGALLYQVGAVMAYLEAVNDGSFHGTAMKRFLEGHEEDKKKMLDDKVSHFFGHLNPMHEKKRHAEEKAEAELMATVDPSAGWKAIHRRERPGSIYPGGQTPAPRRGGVDLGEDEEGEQHEYLTWRWWPTWHALRTHHRFEIGYVACSIQLFGATLYSWCGLVSVPHLADKWTDADYYGGYWFPELFGSCCFLSASIMFLLETQERWYKIQPTVMGWWIGLWAMIGSWGFLLNGVFGVVAQAKPELAWAEFASECCTTWGSFGYLCSALCQWYEAVNKHPVEELFSEPGEMKSWQIHPV